MARSKFQQFVDAHATLYENTSARLRSLVESQADLSWFDKFFGAKPNARFIVIPGLVNGGGNYGPGLRAEDGREEMYAILGVWQVDADKQPSFDKTFLPTLVHEFAHSYVNLLVGQLPALDCAGDAIHQHVRAAMQNQAYADGHTLVCESLVRASTARYILAHDGASAARSAMEEEQRRSFVWTPELFDLLCAYEAGREHYPTFETFMPKIASYFEELAPRAAAMVQNYDATRPKMVAITPANGSLDIDPDLRSCDARRLFVLPDGKPGSLSEIRQVGVRRHPHQAHHRGDVRTQSQLRIPPELCAGIYFG